MEVWRTILYPPQRKCFHRPISWLVNETVKLEIVHLMIKKRRWLVAARTLPFSEENILAAQLFLRRFSCVEPSSAIQFWRWREIQHILELCHMADVNAVNHRKTFFHSADGVTVEIGRPKFKFGEIFHRTQAAL